jgi:hypothetical protein
VTVVLREDVDGFASAVTVTLPDSLPFAGDTVSQAALDEADQEQPVSDSTVRVAELAELARDRLVGVTP